MSDPTRQDYQHLKTLALAEMYGAGDVKIGRLTGQYPNPSYADELVRLRGDDLEKRILAVFKGSLDCFGYIRWTPSSCRRCGYEQTDCTCVGGFAAPSTKNIEGAK